MASRARSKQCGNQFVGRDALVERSAIRHREITAVGSADAVPKEKEQQRSIAAGEQIERLIELDACHRTSHGPSAISAMTG